MKIKIYLLLILLFASEASIAQSVKFYKHYSTLAELNLNDLDTTSSGEFIAAGSSYNSNGNNAFIIKVDSMGNEMWRYQANYFNGFDSSNYFSCIRGIANNSILAGGNISINSGTNINVQNYLIKLDSLGNILWQKIYGDTTEDYLVDILPSINNSFFTLGVCYDSISNIVLEYFDSTGSPLWRKKYNFTSVNNISKAFVRNSLSSDLIIICSISQGSTYKVGLIEVDINGSQISQSIYSNSNFCIPLDLKELNNNNYSLLTKEYNGTTLYSTITYLDSTFSNPSSVNYAPLFAGSILDSNIFYGAFPDVTYFKGNTALGDTVWQKYVYEEFSSPIAILSNNSSCLTSVGVIDDGVNTFSLGYIIEICDSSSFNTSNSKMTVYKDFNVYPNPSNSGFTVEIDDQYLYNKNKPKIKICNSNGQLVGTYIFSSDKIIISNDIFSSDQYTICLYINNQLINSKKIILK